jgi:hypothetical protein
MAGRSSALDVPFHTPLASWLNTVEGFFSAITRRQIRRRSLPFRRLSAEDDHTPRRRQQTAIVGLAQIPV